MYALFSFYLLKGVLPLETFSLKLGFQQQLYNKPATLTEDLKSTDHNKFTIDSPQDSIDGNKLEEEIK